MSLCQNLFVWLPPTSWEAEEFGVLVWKLIGPAKQQSSVKKKEDENKHCNWVTSHHYYNESAKISFRVICKMLWKNSNEVFGQPSTFLLKDLLQLLTARHVKTFTVWPLPLILLLSLIPLSRHFILSPPLVTATSEIPSCKPSDPCFCSLVGLECSLSDKSVSFSNLNSKVISFVLPFPALLVRITTLLLVPIARGGYLHYCICVDL